MTKICIDCRYCSYVEPKEFPFWKKLLGFSQPYSPAKEHSLCYHPKSMYKKDHEVNAAMVDGIDRTVYHYHYCVNARIFDQICGKDAKWFMPKE